MSSSNIISKIQKQQKTKKRGEKKKKNKQFRKNTQHFWGFHLIFVDFFLLFQMIFNSEIRIKDIRYE